MKTKQSIIYYLALIFGVLLMVNILADKFFLRLDFTEDSRYTLSRPTKNILDSLKETVTITAYFSENLPPEIAQIRRDFKDVLVEYANRSHGKVVYEFVNPNKDDESEQKAMQMGVQPVLVNMREKDQVKQQKVYLGAVVQMNEQKEVVPFIQAGSAIEYSLSTSIKKLSVTNKPTIGYMQGHGEAGLSFISQAYDALSVLYRIEPVTLNDSTSNLDKYTTVVILAPKDSFPASHLQQLDAYMAKGRNLFLAINRVKADLQTQPPSATAQNIGLETWLTKRGINVESNLVIDQACGSITVMQQQGTFQFRTNVMFPYLPTITTFTEHPITKGLSSVMLQFASSIVYTGDKTITFTPLAKTSDKAGTQAVPLYFDVQKQWAANDFTIPNSVVAGLFIGNLVAQRLRAWLWFPMAISRLTAKDNKLDKFSPIM